MEDRSAVCTTHWGEGSSHFGEIALLIQLEVAKTRCAHGDNVTNQNRDFRSSCTPWTVNLHELGVTIICSHLYQLPGASRTVPCGSLVCEQLKPHQCGYPGWRGHLHQQLLFAMELSTAAPYQAGEEEKDCLHEIIVSWRSYNSRLSPGEAGGKVGRALSVKSDSLDNCFTGELAALITTSQLLLDEKS